MPYIIGGLVLAALIIVYVVVYKLNAKTAVPEGCENIATFSGCAACANEGCGVRKGPEAKTTHDKK